LDVDLINSIFWVKLSTQHCLLWDTKLYLGSHTQLIKMFMPRIYPDYLGLSFWVYFRDHPPPHVHVKFGEFKAVINIDTGMLTAGYLPEKKRKLALGIIRDNKADFIEKFATYSK
ncbi:MAG: hypothetical protein RIS84_583, partial [Pseudomonadota bacterium]